MAAFLTLKKSFENILKESWPPFSFMERLFHSSSSSFPEEKARDKTFDGRSLFSVMIDLRCHGLSRAQFFYTVAGLKQKGKNNQQRACSMNGSQSLVLF